MKLVNIVNLHKNYFEISDDVDETNNTHSQIRFKSTILKFI